MKNRSKFVRDSILISLFYATVSMQATAEEVSDSPYTYKDDWAVVSAPPPPGPYRAVNIDPRIPGVDATPPISMEATSAAVESGIPVSALENAPAAGIPAYAVTPDKPAEAVEPITRPAVPVPATRAPSPPGYYYPVQPRYPVQSRNAPPGVYRNYQPQRPYGYYPAPAYPQGQQQVPPPPVYDAIKRQPGRSPAQGMP